MRQIGRACSALALLLGATVLPGCGAPTNLTQVANDVQAALMSMPGVTDAWVYHDENYAEGVVFNVAVDVPTATPDQITAIADRIAATRIDLITSYTQNVEFWVVPDKPVTISRQSRIDARQVADDAERLRVIAADADGRIDWFRGDNDAANQLSFNESHTSGADLLDAVRRTAGDTGVTLSVSPASPSHRTPRMVVSFPLSDQDQTSVLRFLDSVPVDVFGLRIDTGGVRALEAMVPADTTTAEQELSAVVDASEAVAVRPMWLAWYVPSAAGGVPVFDGVVEVGDCSAPAAAIRQAAQQVNRQDDSTLQARLQSKVDTCTAAAPIRTEWTQPPPPTRFPSPVTALGQRPVPHSTRTPTATRVADRPTPVLSPCGTKQLVSLCLPSTSGSNSRPVRLPALVRTATPPIPSAPRPAAAQDSTKSPPSGNPTDDPRLPALVRSVPPPIPSAPRPAAAQDSTKSPPSSGPADDPPQSPAVHRSTGRTARPGR